VTRHTNTTGYNGMCKSGKNFVAQIYFDGKTKNFGLFTRARDAARDAAMAYDEEIVKVSSTTHQV